MPLRLKSDYQIDLRDVLSHPEQEIRRNYTTGLQSSLGRIFFMKKRLNKKIEIVLVSISALLALVAIALMVRNDQKNLIPIVEHNKVVEEVAKNALVIGTPLHEKVATPKQEKISTDSYVAEVPETVLLTAGGLSIGLAPLENKTLYTLLIEANEQKKMNVQMKEYPGLGFYVTSIGTLTETNGKHLIYYVNGKDATVGISAYVPKVGDTIDWKLE